MIITSHVFIAKNKRTEAYYKSLGYSLISVAWSRYRQFYVKLEDLPNSSRVRVVAKCKCCGKDREISFHQYREICHACNNQNHSGENSPKWKGGDFRNTCKCGKPIFRAANQCVECYNNDRAISEEDRKLKIENRKITSQEYRNWRTDIFEIGGYTCDKCGDSTGGNLVAHHLESWGSNKELRYSVSNGVCLCKNCHTIFHKIYGFGNNTTQQYLEFKEANHG